MGLGQIHLGDIPVSRMIIGGNPFSGFSHQTEAKDLEMCRYFTTQRIKDTLRRAESLGVNTHLGRADHHIMRVLLEYWDEGGSIQWIAQTCPEVGDIPRGIQNGIRGGAKACWYVAAPLAPQKCGKVEEARAVFRSGTRGFRRERSSTAKMKAGYA